MKKLINKIKEWWNFLQLRDDEPEFNCYTCEDTGVVTINPGYCGGCEYCGSLEEKEVPCLDCQL